MTLTTARLERLRLENRADLATLREVADLSELLYPAARPRGETVPTVWWISPEAAECSYPTLVLGIRDDVGFLRWYDDGNTCRVPVGVEYRGVAREYYHGGYSHDCDSGEELPAELVRAATAEFVATGRRPACVEWMNEADVPNHATPLTLEEHPAYQAIRDAIAPG